MSGGYLSGGYLSGGICPRIVCHASALALAMTDEARREAEM